MNAEVEGPPHPLTIAREAYAHANEAIRFWTRKRNEAARSILVLIGSFGYTSLSFTSDAPKPLDTQRLFPLPQHFSPSKRRRLRALEAREIVK